MTITINVQNVVGQINVPVHITANITSDIPIKSIEWESLSEVNFSVSLDQKTLNFTPSANGVYIFRITVDGVSKDVTVTVGTAPPPPITCPPGQHSENGVCVPDVVNPPEPPTPPSGNAKYNSNVQGKWNNGQARFVTDREGDVKADGFGFTVNASGGGGFRIDGKGQGNLEPASTGNRRIYICCCNYNATIKGQFIFLDDKPDNMSLKGRSRHQFADEVQKDAPDNKKQGGLGCSFHRDGTIDFKVEIVHGTYSNGTSKSIGQKLVTGKWYPFEFTYKDNNGKVDETAKITIDGKVITVTNTESPPSQFFNKADFDTWSQFWLRDNNSGKIGFKDIELIPL